MEAASLIQYSDTPMTKTKIICFFLTSWFKSTYISPTLMRLRRYGAVLLSIYVLYMYITIICDGSDYI